MTITDIKSFQVLNLQGLPTIKCIITLNHNVEGSAVVPNNYVNKSIAYNLFDENVGIFSGNSVLTAIMNINNQIRNKLVGKQNLSQNEFDKILKELDSTDNMSEIGSNASLAVSMAYCRAVSNYKDVSLFSYIKNNIFKSEERYYNSIPLITAIESNKKLKSPEFDKLLLITQKSKSFAESLQICHNVMTNLLKEFSDEEYEIGKFGAIMHETSTDTYDFCERIERAITNAGYSTDEIGIGIESSRKVEVEDPKVKFKSFMSKFKNFNLIYLTDPSTYFGFDFDEEHYKQLRSKFENIQIVSNYETNGNIKNISKELEKKTSDGATLKISNSVVISDIVKVAKLLEMNQMNLIGSSNVFNSEDNFLVDLCIASKMTQVSIGGILGPYSISKFNRFLEIEQKEDLLMYEWAELFEWE